MVNNFVAILGISFLAFYSCTNSPHVDSRAEDSVVVHQMTLAEWNEESKENIRCLPKYGHAEKSAGELEADSKFIQGMLARFSNKRLASADLIKVGFDYVYRDVKTAMYRFNQAYLLDSTNSDIYWGFGGVYMVLGDYPRARAQYEEGLLLDPVNSHILTDFGTYFMAQGKTDSAILYFNRSYQIDSSEQNNLFKIAVAYYYKNDCRNAVYFYEKCKSLGGQQMSNEFIDSLRQKCKIK